MSSLFEFEDVSFSYPTEEGPAPVFSSVTLKVPEGITGFLGPNGTGKSTLLLLAAGRLKPVSGRVLLKGTDTRSLTDEAQKNSLASVIFQNLEFENEEPVAELLEQVFENGFHTQGSRGLIEDVMVQFELKPILNRKTQVLSKGEMQRVILAFSLLYGSQSLFLDEPIFALEEAQKQQSLEFLTHYCKTWNRSMVFCLHEMELTQKYCQYLVLFSKKMPLKFGKTSDLYEKSLLESIYGVPWDLMKQKENLKREMLMRGSKISQETLAQTQVVP